MKVDIVEWKVGKLLSNVGMIDYPEFQREPSVWNLEKKQRLIDSILRGFNISLIYFFKNDKDKYDCIDGRQRINAILSYLNANASYDEADNGFHLKLENEIYGDAEEFEEVNNLRWVTIEKDEKYAKWKRRLLNYKLHIAMKKKKKNDEELNLLFLRLQIASILNAGEKLNAMTGDMRDWIFIKLCKHSFFSSISIPQRRFAREQVAAQIVINEFSKKDTGTFHRARYIDLQDFFKEFSKMDAHANNLKKQIESNLDTINKNFGTKLKYIRNRAIAVSVYLFISQLVADKKEEDIKEFVEFFVKFMKTLKWQLPKGVKMDSSYHDILNFQTNISQAAGEKRAIQARHDFIRKYFYYYKQSNGEIVGDREYYNTTHRNPDTLRSKIVL